MNLSIVPLLFALAPGVLTPINDRLGASAPLDRGYRQMYNLEFNGAHNTFTAYTAAHPEDPFGHTSNGAAYLFEEFHRLGVLQTELFTDDEKFMGREKPTPDPRLRREFVEAIARSQRLADANLKRNPNDRNALFATVLNLGLESDYQSLVERRDIAALSYAKRAGNAAERLLALDSTYYDAYLAVGIENYILGLKPAPVRWMLRLYGAQTDKDLGVKKLQLTATKGHYLLPYARLLLAVAALRDQDRTQAKALLQNLAQEFPNNQLYRRELLRIQ
jgi:hypothetical protein